MVGSAAFLYPWALLDPEGFLMASPWNTATLINL